MKMSGRSISILIAIISLALFVPFLGGSHLFDWDEVNFAEAAREMLVTQEFTYVQINFKPFWEKPPLFIWMQALSMSIFGINEFAARFPNAICGAITLVLLFNIGRRLVSKNFGLLWVLVYAGSLLPQFYFRSGIIDPWFNLFIFAGIHQLILATESKIIEKKRLGISALFIGLAVMTKGPTALGLVGICAAAYFIISFKKHQWKIVDATLYLATVIFIGFSWFLIEIARGHGYVVQEFIDYHIRLFSESEAGHAQPFFYHPIILLLGCFPMSLFLLFSWIKKPEQSPKTAHYQVWMNILFWVVLIVFSIVKTKIIHYSSLTYFPISFLAAWFIYQRIKDRITFKIWQLSILAFFVVVLSISFFLVGVLNSIKKPLLNLIDSNSLAYGNFNQQIVDGTIDPFIGPFFLLTGLASIFLLYQGKTRNGIIGLFGSTLITITLLSVLLAPKIDRYTQSELFSFYEEKGNESYLQPIGFHSYAHLFYGKREAIFTEPEDEVKWMIFNEVDKPVYFISRSQDLETTLGYFPHLKEIDRIGGYVILERTDETYPFLGLP